MQTLTLTDFPVCEVCDAPLTRLIFKANAYNRKEVACPVCFTGYAVENEVKPEGNVYTVTKTDENSLDISLILGLKSDSTERGTVRAPNIYPLNISVNTKLGKNISVIDIRDTYIDIHQSAQDIVNTTQEFQLSHELGETLVLSVLPQSVVDEVNVLGVSGFFRDYGDALHALAKSILKSPKKPPFTTRALVAISILQSAPCFLFYAVSILAPYKIEILLSPDGDMAYGYEDDKVVFKDCSVDVSVARMMHMVSRDIESYIAAIKTKLNKPATPLRED